MAVTTNHTHHRPPLASSSILFERNRGTLVQYVCESTPSKGVELSRSTFVSVLSPIRRKHLSPRPSARTVRRVFPRGIVCMALFFCPCCCLFSRCWPYTIRHEPEPPKPPPVVIELDKLPSYEYEPRTPNGSGDQGEDECSICLATLEPGDIVRRLRCTHCFHKPCIDRWLLQKARCPLCLGNPVGPQALPAPGNQDMVREA